MSAATMTLSRQHDVLLPQPIGGNAPGAALALLVHVGLLLALTTAVNWRTKAPEVFSAELWASVPQVAAPIPPAPVAPVAPPPPPPAARAQPTQADADIAIEQARKRKVEEDKKRADDLAAEAERKRVADKKKADDEKQRLEDDKKRAEDEKKKAEEDKKKREQEAAETKADEERLARQREENLRRMMGQAGGAAGNAGGTGTATRNAAPTAAYTGKLIARIRPNIVYTGNAPASATAEVEVRAAPGGSIISRRLVKSSGFKEWDDAVLRAIDRTPSLPRDTDGRVPDQLTIAFRRD
jgi:colicin import membrane protein